MVLFCCLNNLKEQVRSGDASATELFELGAVMLRRKFYPAANKFLLQAIQKWDGDDQDLAQVIIQIYTHKHALFPASTNDEYNSRDRSTTLLE